MIMCVCDCVCDRVLAVSAVCVPSLVLCPTLKGSLQPCEAVGSGQSDCKHTAFFMQSSTLCEITHLYKHFVCAHPGLRGSEGARWSMRSKTMGIALLGLYTRMKSDTVPAKGCGGVTLLSGFARKPRNPMKQAPESARMKSETVPAGERGSSVSVIYKIMIVLCHSAMPLHTR